MKSEFRDRDRPIGVFVLVVVSAIMGSIIFSVAVWNFIDPTVEKEKPLYKEQKKWVVLGILPILNALFMAFGIIYIILAIGFFRADAWALKLYNNVNRAISITTIFYGNLVVSGGLGNSPLNAIVAQLGAVLYTFTVNTYLQRKGVKLYFGSTDSSGAPVQRSSS
jgi:hypothetical protein